MIAAPILIATTASEIEAIEKGLKDIRTQLGRAGMQALSPEGLQVLCLDLRPDK